MFNKVRIEHIRDTYKELKHNLLSGGANTDKDIRDTYKELKLLLPPSEFDKIKIY